MEQEPKKKRGFFSKLLFKKTPKQKQVSDIEQQKRNIEDAKPSEPTIQLNQSHSSTVSAQIIPSELQVQSWKPALITQPVQAFSRFESTDSLSDSDDEEESNPMTLPPDVPASPTKKAKLEDDSALDQLMSKNMNMPSFNSFNDSVETKSYPAPVMPDMTKSKPAVVEAESRSTPKVMMRSLTTSPGRKPINSSVFNKFESSSSDDNEEDETDNSSDVMPMKQKVLQRRSMSTPHLVLTPSEPALSKVTLSVQNRESSPKPLAPASAGFGAWLEAARKAGPPSQLGQGSDTNSAADTNSDVSNLNMGPTQRMAKKHLQKGIHQQMRQSVYMAHEWPPAIGQGPTNLTVPHHRTAPASPQSSGRQGGSNQRAMGAHPPLISLIDEMRQKSTDDVRRFNRQAAAISTGTDLDSNPSVMSGSSVYGQMPYPMPYGMPPYPYMPSQMMPMPGPMSMMPMMPMQGAPMMPMQGAPMMSMQGAPMMPMQGAPMMPMQVPPHHSFYPPVTATATPPSRNAPNRSSKRMTLIQLDDQDLAKNAPKPLTTRDFNPFQQYDTSRSNLPNNANGAALTQMAVSRGVPLIETIQGRPIPPRKLIQEDPLDDEVGMTVGAV